MYRFFHGPEEKQVAYAELIRAEVPAKDQAKTIASQMTNLIRKVTIQQPLPIWIASTPQPKNVRPAP